MTRVLNIALGIILFSVVAASGYLVYQKTSSTGSASMLERDLEIWEKAVDRDPDNALAHANLAASCQDLGDLDNAIEEFQAALELSPEEYVYMFRLGLAYRAAGEPDSAITMFSQAAGLFPDGEKYAALYQTAEVYFERGDQSMAKFYVQKSIEDNSLIWNSHLLLGRILAAEGDSAKAREELKKAADFNPDSQEIEDALRQVSG